MRRKTSAPPLGLAATIEQIVDLARVPKENRIPFCEEIAELVSNTRYNIGGLDTGFSGDQNQQSEDDEQRRQFRESARRRVLNARSLLKKAAVELQSAIADCDQVYGIHDRSPSLERKRLDKLLAQILAWEAPVRVSSIQAKTRRRGRPRGPIGDPKSGIIYGGSENQFFCFVVCLLSAVNAAGGELKYDKNYPTHGSLMRALELFRPFLPSILENVSPRKILAARSFVKMGFGPYRADGTLRETAWLQE